MVGGLKLVAWTPSQIEMFKINKYITLELRNGKTVIFLDNSEFLLCKGVLVKINTESGRFGYNSIDELISDEIIGTSVLVSPEEEFWVHCSNLQAWNENNYDTRLIHSNLAFPLLEELVRLGDPRAKRAFKDELIKRLLSDYAPTIIFLLKAGYLDGFTEEEFEVLLPEVRKKTFSLDKRVLEIMFKGEDFDEVPPLERFKPRALLFLMEHPKVNLFELLIKYGHLYLEEFYPWIFKFFGRLKKKEPELFKKKVDLLLKKGYLLIPATKEYSEKIGDFTFHDKRSDYSGMDEFAQVFYYRYLRDYDFKNLSS